MCLFQLGFLLRIQIEGSVFQQLTHAWAGEHACYGEAWGTNTLATFTCPPSSLLRRLNQAWPVHCDPWSPSRWLNFQLFHIWNLTSNSIPAPSSSSHWCPSSSGLLPESLLPAAIDQFSSMRAWLWPMVTFPFPCFWIIRDSSEGRETVIGGSGWRMGPRAGIRGRTRPYLCFLGNGR